ncbi:phosphotransferase [Spongiibacter sp. UBA1325]|jgi:hypothetical protein|uniref:phosphotransferase n=1 Tax=Spongiibacter sp. UBA1325 TaxID=1947543 RepID=UPI00257C1E4C|nr:phosphotransferase [Spongiibacter sp. UBA1325]|tara:strand:- start:38790 stop:39935 length:1146 start_codon:yes stop_codon:yes gene_type:complete
MKLSIDEIKAAYDKEYTGIGLVTHRHQIPMAFEYITEAWLTDVLCPHIDDASVTGFKLGAEDEGTSSRRRITLTYNREHPELPKSVFCKSTFTLASRCLLGMNGAIEGEVKFFNQIRPDLDIEAPRAYFSTFNPDTLNSIIILEDQTDHWTFCDHRTVMTESMAKEQLDILATLHSRYYESTALDTSLSYLNSWYDFFTITTNEAGFGPQADVGFRHAKDVIPATLFSKADQIWPATLASVAKTRNQPRTVIHSDVHLKNWYTTAEGKMGLCDWQCMCIGPWGRDLAYAISTGLSIDDRRAWEKDLINYYLGALKQRGGPEIPFEQAWNDYRQNMFGALAWWTPVLCPNPDVPDMQPPETCLAFIGRITNAINDTNALDAL